MGVLDLGVICYPENPARTSAHRATIPFVVRSESNASGRKRQTRKTPQRIKNYCSIFVEMFTRVSENRCSVTPSPHLSTQSSDPTPPSARPHEPFPQSKHRPRETRLLAVTTLWAKLPLRLAARRPHIMMMSPVRRIYLSRKVRREGVHFRAIQNPLISLPVR